LARIPCLLAVAAALPAGCGGEATAAEWRALRPAILERTEVAAARIGNHVYVAGGYLPDRSTTAAVERYGIRANRWTRVRSMPAAVNHAAIAVHDGRLYVVGGYADGNVPTTGLFRYDRAATGGRGWRRCRPHAPRSPRA
jgi:N-acetylneuraminic acid mutarotase